MTERSILSTVDLYGYYGPVAAVQGMTLSVGEHETVGLVGPNGCGKSSFLKSIAGILRTRGSVVLLGRAIDGAQTADRYRSGLGFVPQDRSVIGELSITENLRLSWLHGTKRAPFQQTLDSAFELFPELADRRKVLAGSLSGGQRQMVAVSRGLALCPEVLLLDEPTAGLSPEMVTRLSRVLQQLVQDGLTMMLVEHNIRVAKALCDRVVVMVQGKSVWEGEASAVSREMIAELYLA